MRSSQRKECLRHPTRRFTDCDRFGTLRSPIATRQRERLEHISPHASSSDRGGKRVGDVARNGNTRGRVERDADTSEPYAHTGRGEAKLNNGVFGL
jgi:hypothetical protein